MDALAGLARHAHGIIGRNRQVILNLGLDLVGMGRGQVDLVDGGHDIQVGVHGKRRVGDGLRLDALDIHGVEQLRLHVALLDGMGELKDAVTDRGLAMVYVRNDREVANVGNVN